VPNPNKCGAVSADEKPPQVLVLRGFLFELPGLDSNQEKENQNHLGRSFRISENLRQNME
jgi:hypothetical protein